MTTIALISDIHNEFLRQANARIPDISLEQPADALVLAGDIDCQEHGAVYALRQSELLGIPVIYVLGNHEYYDADTQSGDMTYDKALAITENSNVHILNRDAITIGNTRFIGATLWTDFELLGLEKKKVVMSHAAFNLNDYRNINLVDKPGSPKLTLAVTNRWHAQDRAFIEAELKKPFDGKTVVVTHHAPSQRCLPKHEQNDYISACYASHLDSLIESYQPDVWLYGHIHHPHQMIVGATLVANHARGYPVKQANPPPYKPSIIEI